VPSDLTVVSDNRPAAYLDDDRIILRASSFGSACIRDLVLHLLGEHEPLPVPADLQARFDAGTAAEPHILARVRELGWESKGLAQAEGELKVLPGVYVRFHPDEVMSVPTTSDTRLVECKALAESTFEQARTRGTGSLPFGYDWQLSVMMHALKLPAVWVGLKKNPDDPEDWSGELHLEFVDKPPRSLGEIVKRAKAVRDAYLHAADGGEVPECEGDRYPCPFLYLRPEKEETIEESAGDEADEIDTWGARYEKAREVEAAAKKEKEEARDRLKEIAGARLGVRGRRFRFVRTIQTRTSYDVNAMERDGITLAKYKKVSESERCTVQEVG